MPVADGKAPRRGVSRRDVLKGVGCLAGAAALAGCGVSPGSLEKIFQKRLRELSKEELARVLARIERECLGRFDREVKVEATPPLPDVLFGYALDIARCIGCRRCVYACVDENNQSRDPQIHWITVLQMEKEHGVSLEHAETYYDPERVPQEGKFYFPVQCHQCKNPPCVRVCPVNATWTEPDGIVVIDYDWCIGCRCCITSCPYGARHYNWSEPRIPAGELNPKMHVLGNRPRPKGVVEKCSYCIQRTRDGLYPACVEACPVGARKFGNLLDPESEIRYILEKKRVFIFKEELNTQPKFFYYYGL